MPFMPESYGLNCVREGNSDLLENFGRFLLANAKKVPCYGNGAYGFCEFGDTEFWISLEKTGEKEMTFRSIDFHCGNNCLRVMSAIGDEYNPHVDPLHRLIYFRADELPAGYLPVEVVNPEVLPGILNGDPVMMQLTAPVKDIFYFADEDEYQTLMEKTIQSNQRPMKTGELFPTGIVRNHFMREPYKDREPVRDHLVAFKARVNRLTCGTCTITGEPEQTFIRCFAETGIGELEFDHAYETVPESMRVNMHEGAIVAGTCVISGDVALFGYENGPVMDAEHHLRVLRYTFMRGQAERLRSVLAPDVEYISEGNGKTYRGPDTIISIINGISERVHELVYARMATVTGNEISGKGKNAGTETEPEYGPGTRCVVISYGSPDEYAAIVFVSCNDDGRIKEIHISEEEKYSFRVDRD